MKKYDSIDTYFQRFNNQLSFLETASFLRNQN